MKTEPNVAFYTSKAKERICHCLVQVCEPISTKHVVCLTTLFLLITTPLSPCLVLSCLSKWFIIRKSNEGGKEACLVCHLRSDRPTPVHLVSVGPIKKYAFPVHLPASNKTRMQNNLGSISCLEWCENCAFYLRCEWVCECKVAFDSWGGV